MTEDQKKQPQTHFFVPPNATSLPPYTHYNALPPPPTKSATSNNSDLSSHLLVNSESSP